MDAASRITAQQDFEGQDGLVVSVDPDPQSVGSSDGFTLSVTDANPSELSFSEYYLTGLKSGWKVYSGADEIQPSSPDPLIYKIAKDDALAGRIRIVAPSDYQGTLSDVQLSRVSDSRNLITDFDNGTFDYLGTAKPQLSSGSTAYTWHDPTVLAQAPEMGCSTLQYAPCDGSYSIWPTANMNGPGDAEGNHYNNFWADLRSIDDPMTDPTTEVISKDWDKTGGPGGIQAVNTAQVTDEESAASGKILVVNGSTRMPLPNDLIHTTVNGLQPNSVYTVTGYLANVSSNQTSTDLAEVRSSFFADVDGNDTLIGSSQALPRQSSGYNTGIGMWTKAVGYFSTGPDQTSVTLGVRNFGSGGFGNDIAIDNLRLSPMASATFSLRVISGSITWTKVDQDGNPLGATTWKVTPRNGASIAVTDNGDNDADPTVGALKLTNLAFGTYDVVESSAPAGYEVNPQVRTVTIDSNTPDVTLPPLVNDRVPGEVSWTKVDANDPGTLLGGSQWSLAAADGPTMTIVDNGANDNDPADGALKVSGLAWGTYTLTEKQAPNGYLIDAKPTTFEISAQSTSVTLPAVSNTKAAPAMLIAKTSDPASGSHVTPGQRITYTVTVRNTGNVDLTPARISDNLSDVLDNATYVDGSAVARIGDTQANAPSVDTTAATLVWSDTLPSGATATITYAVVVKAGVSAQDRLVNVVTGTGDVPPGITPPSSNCTPSTAASNPDCSTTHTPTTPSLAVTGADSTPAIIAGLLLLGLGGAALLMGVKRRRAD